MSSAASSTPTGSTRISIGWTGTSCRPTTVRTRPLITSAPVDGGKGLTSHPPAAGRWCPGSAPADFVPRSCRGAATAHPSRRRVLLDPPGRLRVQAAAAGRDGQDRAGAAFDAGPRHGAERTPVGATTDDEQVGVAIGETNERGAGFPLRDDDPDVHVVREPAGLRQGEVRIL